MLALPCSPRSIGRWLLAVLALTGASLVWAGPQDKDKDKAPPAPMGEPATKPAETPPAANGEKMVAFEFRDKRWNEVLEWLSEQTGLPVISVNKPTGSLTYISPPGKDGKPVKYTIPKVIDLINEGLASQKYLLIRRDASFTIVPADMPLSSTDLPRVAIDNMSNRGDTEVVQTVLPLKTLVAESYLPEVLKMKGPYGDAISLEKSNQILLTDTVGNIKRIYKTTQDIESAEESATQSYSHPCQYIKCREADRILRDLMGDPKLLQAQIQASMNQRDREGRPIPPPANVGKVRMFYITPDERTETVLISGPPDKIAQAKDILKKIDVAQPGQVARRPAPPEIKQLTVPPGSASDVVKMLSTIYTGSQSVRISQMGPNAIMVYAPPEDLMDIAKLISGATPGGGTGVITKLIPLGALEASAVEMTLKGMFVTTTVPDFRTPGATPPIPSPYIEGDKTRNVIIAKGTAEQLADIEAAIKVMESGGSGGTGTMRVITLDKGSGAATAEALKRMLMDTRQIPANVIMPGKPIPPTPMPMDPPMPRNDGPKPGSGGGGSQGPDEPKQKPVTITVVGNRLMINSEDPAALAYTMELIRLLTRTDGEGDFEVIKLTTANATDAARVINEMFNGPPERGQQQQNPFAAFGGFGGFNRGGNTPGTPGAPSASAKVRVVADPGSNSLIVKASPIEMLQIRNLIATSIDKPDSSAGTMKAHMIGPLKSANVAEVAQVVQSVYRDYTGQDSRGGSFGGFPGFGFGGLGGFGGGGLGGGGRGGATQRPTDANGNPKPNPLSIGIDDRANTLIVFCNEALYKDIDKLVQDLEKQAAGAVRTVKIIPIKGIDPNVVQTAIDAIQGFSAPTNSGQMGGQRGGGGFQGGFGGGQGFGGGSPFGGGFGGGQGFGGGGQGFGGGGRGFGGGGQGFGGGGGRGFGGGGGGGRGFGGGGRGGFNRAPDRESGGPDFFEQGVKDDQTLPTLFDPQQATTYARQTNDNGPRLKGPEEQQAPLPAGQPAPATTQPPAAQPPAGAPGTLDNFQGPRRRVLAEALEELGVIVITGENQSDIDEILKIIDYIQKSGAGSEVKLEVVPLKYGDATSISTTLSQVFARVFAGPSGNFIVAGNQQQRPQQGGALGGFGGQGGAFGGQQGGAQGAVAQIQQPLGSLLFLPLPRFNSILVAAPEQRLKDVKKEIEKLDQPTTAAGRATPFPLKKASAQTVATLIQQFYAQRYSTEQLGQNQIRVTFDTPSNTVFVQAGPADLDEVRGLIEWADTNYSSAVNDLRIYKLKNALSDELAATLNTAVSIGVVVPGTTAAQGIVPQPGTGAQTPFGGAGQAGRAGATGQQPPTTKTTSLRFFAQPDSKGLNAGALEDVHITSELRSNSLIVSAPPDTMAVLFSLIRELDVPAASLSAVNIFTLKKADAVQTATLLRQLFSGTTTTTGAAGGPGAAFGGAGAAGQAGAGTAGQQRPILSLNGSPSDGAALIDLRLSVDDRTNSIIVAGSRNDLEVIEAVISKLESSDVQQRRSDVYKLRNAAAADVATALTTFITNSRTVLQTGNALTAFAEIQRDVVIVPESISNTLLISATPQMFADMMRIVSELDAMPPQVIIQCLIAEVDFLDNQEFGVELGGQSPVFFRRSLFNPSPATTTAGAPNIGAPGFLFNSTAPLGNSSIAQPGVVGFQGISQLGVGRTSPTAGVGGLVLSAGSQSLNVLIRALKNQNRIDILSRPQVMTLDNQTAAVSIGQDFPFLSNSSVTATGVITNNVDRRTVGVVLRVTPRITPEGKVLMRVAPEVSTVGPTVVLTGGSLNSGQVNGQVFNIQQVDTTVVGQDGETIVIGGLILQDDTKNENKVPMLGDLPYIGGAFRYRTQIRHKRELIVILTPHVVRCQADADRIAAEEARRMDWILSDVAKMHTSNGLSNVLPQPKLPEMPPPMIPMQPAAVAPQGTPLNGMPLIAPPGTPVIPGTPLNPGTVTPTIPATPALPVPAPISRQNVAPTGRPLVQAKGPTAQAAPPVPPAIIDPATTGPTLTPASYTAPAQTPPVTPASKEAQGWKLGSQK